MKETSIYLAAVLALGVGAQWLAWLTKLPAIVLLLAFGFALGIAVGPPERYVGAEALLPVISLAVGVILFEGGLTLQFREVKETRSVVLRLVTVGLLVTWGASAAAAHWLMGFSWPMATLLGALLTVSGPTVILPLLRQVRPTGRVGSVMKWEGIINDPIGAVLAALVFEVVAHGMGEHLASEAAWILGKTALVGLLLGGSGAALVVYLLSRYLVPDFLQNPIVLGLVVVVFAVSNAVAEESGLVTVTIMGLVLANQRRVTVKHVVEFKENLRVLLIAALFILLSSRVEIGWEQLSQIGWGGLGFVAVLILVIRPAATLLATVGSDLSRNERLLLAWIHPRGIVAAAVASLFALGLQKNEELAAEGDRLVLATFLVIVGTVLTYGLTLGPLARQLGLSKSNPQGVLFAGATPLARKIAEALAKEDIPTLLVDTNPQSVQAARMAGLRAHYASIGSEFVHQGLDLGGIGRLLAMTPNDEVNTIASTEFREVFGSENVYQLAPSQKTGDRQRRIPTHLRGRLLFDDEATFDNLRRRLESGAELKKTTLSDEFTYEDFIAKYGDTAVVLMKFPEPGKLRIDAEDNPIDLKDGGKILALVDPPEGGFDASTSGILA
ncbi:MAG: cation:proton antiporter [Planctomycetota bacterium]